MPHLGVITTSFPRFPGDHAGSFVFRELLELIEVGHRVTVVAPRSDQPHRARPWAPRLRVVEAPTPQGVFYGPGAPERLRGATPTLYARAALATVALERSARRALRACDAILAHWRLPSGVIAARVARGRPYGVMAHSAGAQLALRAPRPARFALKHTLRRAAYVSSTDPKVARRLGRLLGRRVSWTAARANTAPLRALSPARSAVGELRVGFLGRRAPVKGLDRLLAALSPMPPGISLVVAGPGPAVCQAGVQELGELRGDAALRDFFARVDVLALPSRRVEGGRSEGLPCALLEAWAAGRGALGSAVGGMEAVLEGRWRLPEGAPSAAWRARLEALRDVSLCGDSAREELARLEARWAAERRRDLGAVGIRTDSRC